MKMKTKTVVELPLIAKIPGNRYRVNICKPVELPRGWKPFHVRAWVRDNVEMLLVDIINRKGDRVEYGVELRECETCYKPIARLK